jgi:ribosome-associated heat shock protein Hsp15
VNGEDHLWQRLDKWLWCARFMKARGACAELIAGGSVRINRQVTEKAHAKLRVGDVLTLPLPRDQVRVVEVIALATRRGPAAEARALYRELTAEPLIAVDPQTRTPQTSMEQTSMGRSCNTRQTASYADHEDQ